ncbi:MAG: hypothetical protein VXZ84_04225 [Planctomycetota bacterium]|nr:hypothetical protein [Planctomycetota bacterium]
MILFALIEFATKLRNSAFMSLAAFLTFFGGHENLSAEPVAPDAFPQMDKFFRSTYVQARDQTLRDTGPVIFVQSEDLILFYDGKSIKSAPPLSDYRTLTTVSHLTLTIFLLLEPYGEGPLSESRIDSLKTLQNLTKSMQSELSKRMAENPDMVESQKRVIAKTLSLIKQIIAQKSWSTKDLDDFLDDVKPQILQNIKLAAKFRIDHFHRQIVIWKQNISTEDWDRLHVIVSGPAMPRKNNLAVQYFSKLLGVRGEGEKIIYAESVFQPTRARQILGTNLLDAQIGEGYFGDPWRMHRDLLGNAAAVYLDGVSLSLPE